MKITTACFIEPDTKSGEIKHTEQKIVGTGETAVSYVFINKKKHEAGKSVEIKNALVGEITESTVKSLALAVSETVRLMIENMPEKMKLECQMDFIATIIAELDILDDDPIISLIKKQYRKESHREE